MGWERGKGGGKSRWEPVMQALVADEQGPQQGNDRVRCILRLWEDGSLWGAGAVWSLRWGTGRRADRRQGESHCNVQMRDGEAGGPGNSGTYL